MNRNNYRHGDISFHQLDEKDTILALKNGGEKKERKNLDEYVVALGEATGHKHVLRMESPGSLTVVEIVGEGRVIFELKSKGTMSHDEHDSFEMEPGTYERKIEREFDPFEAVARQALD